MSASSASETAYERRFKFLFPTLSSECRIGRPVRFQLIAPDLLELRWSVFDRRDRSTVASGQTAEEAVDAAITRSETLANLEQVEAVVGLKEEGR